MIELITFEGIDSGYTVIKLQHSTGETTILGFSSIFPLKAKEYYLKVINEVIKQNPDLSPSKTDFLSLFSRAFWISNLEAPISVQTIKNTDRLRIGKRIQELRELENLSLEQVAKRADIQPGNLYRIEQGRYNVNFDLLSKIANAMGYKVDFVKL